MKPWMQLSPQEQQARDAAMTPEAAREEMEALVAGDPSYPLPDPGEQGEDFLARRVRWSLTSTGGRFRALQSWLRRWEASHPPLPAAKQEPGPTKPALPPELLAAYQATRYEVYLSDPPRPETTIVLRIGERSEPLARLIEETGFYPGIFITAWNPFSATATEADNHAANLRLKRSLVECCDAVYAGRGISADGVWYADGFLGLGLNRAVAKWLGQEYAQHAVVFFGQDAVPELLISMA